MIEGMATATIVVSTRIMKKPRHRAHSAGHGRACVPFIGAFLERVSGCPGDGLGSAALGCFGGAVTLWD